ncbi:putative major capsid protein [Methylophilales phage MEP402]|nr:putative major capsid protein [Methylophilales phage MEP402]
MAHTTANTTAFIESQQYSQFILDNLHDYLLPEGMYRDVTDFGSGTTLNIKTVGTVTLQDAAEDTPLNFTNIDTGTITLSITDYIGDAWKVTDDLREDGSQVDQLMAMRAMESTRALGENHEGRFLAVANGGQTAANLNLVNGRPHRFVAGGSGASTRNVVLGDFVAMKLAFDKANAPASGRIAIVDPIVEATLNTLISQTSVVNNTPQFQGVLNEGFARDHRFVRNIMGWDIYTSNFLPSLTATEAINASAYDLANDTAEIGDKANIFMCVADDSCKPVMHAWRRAPQTEGWRDQEERADKYQVTSRFGFGVQRADTLGVLLTDEATY